MLKHHCIYYIRIRPPLRSILFPYTTLFRSWLETNNLFNNLIQRNQSAAFSSGKVRPNHETNINIIARIGFAERSEERFSRNAETDLVCRLLLEKKKKKRKKITILI